MLTAFAFCPPQPPPQETRYNDVDATTTKAPSRRNRTFFMTITAFACRSYGYPPFPMITV